jgi:NDP-sugar pyrophosphorylase family protein
MYAVILAAGKGTRMRPLSYYLPKILLPVRGEPVLNYLIRNVESLDPDRIYIVASEHLDEISKYLEKTNSKNVKVVRGLEFETGGDLSLALEQIENRNQDAIVMNGDIVTDVDMKEVFDFHEKSDSYVTASLFEMKDREEAKRFGRVQINGRGKIIKFLEKAQFSPDPKSLVNVGFYIFDKTFIRKRNHYFSNKKFKLETDLFPRLSSEGHMYGFVTNPKYWWDVGTLESYIKAENFMINMEGILPP